MNSTLNIPLIVLVIGLLTILALLVKAVLRKGKLPALIGLILVGLVLRILDDELGLLSATGEEVLHILGKIGVICLLFRIGLESDLDKLFRQLRSASFIWMVSFVSNAATGFALAYWVIGLALIPSIFAAAALTATSVGIAARIWDEADVLNTRTGTLLLDTAELNDLSGVVVLALLIDVVPVLRESTGQPALREIGTTLALVFVKLVGFGTLCFAFAAFIEEKYTTFMRSVENRTDFMITVVGTAFVFAAAAGLLQFSLAIGAFFAGVIFSRDPKAVRIEGSFNAVHDLFVPFFFIGFGLSVDPGAVVPSLTTGAVLSPAALGVMFLAVFAASAVCLSPKPRVLMAAGMTPRAEIAMVIIERGTRFGAWAVPPKLLGGMVVVSLVTCIVVPIGLRVLLGRWRHTLTATEDT